MESIWSSHTLPSSSSSSSSTLQNLNRDTPWEENVDYSTHPMSSYGTLEDNDFFEIIQGKPSCRYWRFGISLLFWLSVKDHGDIKSPCTVSVYAALYVFLESSREIGVWTHHSGYACL